MKRNNLILIILMTLASVSCSSTFNANRALLGGQKTLAALTLSDEQIREYVHQFIVKSDAENVVLPSSSPYVKRLNKMVAGLTSVDGVPLNFKVYKNDEANAFACADGSVRVYTKLMDIMSDEEVLGVIGHEIGHVALKHSRKAYQKALINSAIADGLASQSETIAVLTDSQLGALGQAILNAQYSKKQELEADDYGYEFLKKSSKNPVVMAKAFSKLKQLGGGSVPNDMVSNLLSSHPNLDARIDRVLQRARNEGYYKQ